MLDKYFLTTHLRCRDVENREIKEKEKKKLGAVINKITDLIKKRDKISE